MEYRTLDLTLISAKGIKIKNATFTGDVYAVASISGTYQKLKTPVNKGSGPNPIWNFPMQFRVNEAAAMQNHRALVVKIKSVGFLVNRELGEVRVAIKELMEGLKSDGKAMQFVSYRVRSSSGKLKGELSFSYKFGEKFVVKVERPVTAYPPRPRRAVGCSRDSATGGAMNGMLVGSMLSGGGGGGCGGGGGHHGGHGGCGGGGGGHHGDHSGGGGHHGGHSGGGGHHGGHGGGGGGGCGGGGCGGCS